ncbi:MAG: GNAT family N-acetyltransferase [Gemmatimonadetes bacterium]|nr:GNAT family N-acetyltransferase [Gemmatimonadota bacterium]
MPIVTESALESLLPWRERYRAAMAAQIVHDSWHQRGFTTLYRIAEDGITVGYAALGAPPGEPHQTVKEFFVTPDGMSEAPALFAAVLRATRATHMEAQTNDPFLAPLLQEFSTDREAHTLLFAEGGQSHFTAPGGVRLRAVRPEDHAAVFPHSTEPIGDWGLDLNGELVATGGLFSHYNPPYGDIYMEVAPAHRRRGLASYLVQELKRIARDRGFIAAARCNRDNAASRRALERGGMLQCGEIVRGRVAARDRR